MSDERLEDEPEDDEPDGYDFGDKGLSIPIDDLRADDSPCARNQRQRRVHRDAR